MKTVYLLISLLFPFISFGQDIAAKLGNAISRLEKDKQFTHAIISMYVVDSKTGKTVFEKNSQLGLAPASCQKVITSAAAFELLGKDYTYKTEVGYDGTITNNNLYGNLYFIGNGDPTFGSWRWKETGKDFIMKTLKDKLSSIGIKTVNAYVVDNTKWGTATLPGGWVWEDIGNYYGAGCSAFNWHENQYNIVLKPGEKVGDPVKVISKFPPGINVMINELKTAAKGTGDQAYVYAAPESRVNYIRGTIPLGVDSFVIAASAAHPANLFQQDLIAGTEGSMMYVMDANATSYSFANSESKTNVFKGEMEKLIFNFVSPPLDSINYWFLKKSVNLFGEAFVKAIAFEKTKNCSTDTGVAVIRDFWSKNGIDKTALHIIDGSGLSPANRVTTNALVQVMQFARTRPWFSSFYDALPEMNGIKMKDGYISGVRSYTGYVKRKSGNEYIFSFIVNNFDGNPGTVREKIWSILDLLK